MEIKAISGDITKMPVDAIVVNLFEGVKSPGGATGAVDRALDGAISNLIAAKEIKGKLNEVVSIYTFGKIEPQRVVVAGLGKREEFTFDKIREVMAATCKSLRSAEVKRVATIVHGAGIGGMNPMTCAQAITEGSLLGTYTFRKYMTKEPEFGEIDELLIVERDEKKLPVLKEGVRKGRILSEATNFARDLVNEPANYLTPTDLAKEAQKVAESYELEFSVLEREEMENLGMGALLGVARGSQEPPKFIVLKYQGAGDSSKNALGLVGKGITFDSGGISIKPSEGMGEMKGDMAGGAAVIAAMRAIGELKPKIEVVGLVPATENLPSGSALKPADVLKAMNGKTIEVLNTDAEGRLILADALCYAKKLGLSPIVDMATLTGACYVALGDFYSGAFSNNQELVSKVMQSGEESGEKFWQLPMGEEYKKQIKSDVADIKNIGERYGGAITAAQFLAEFVEDTPWVHLDIAGTSFGKKERSYLPKGATGVGVRTLVNLALTLAEK